MSCVMGIDPSLSGFALCAYTGSEPAWAEHESKSAPTDNSVRARMTRYAKLVDRAVLTVRDLQPHVIVIEGYSFGSTGGKAFDRAECRAHFIDRIIPRLSVGTLILECPPNTLKMFATGKGAGDKTAVATALTHRYGRPFTSDNAADAYALCRIGMVIDGICEADNEAQRRAVATVLGQKPAKKSKVAV